VSLVGIDIGMTGCKAAAFSEDGRTIASAYREYAMLRPRQGWAELDSRAVWRHTRDVIGEVASQTKADPITALSVSSMGEAMVPVSRDRDILGSAITCLDARGQQYVDQLRRFKSDEAFYSVNPNVLSVAYSLPKLLWLKEHEPDLFAAADYFLLWADFVAFMLGCEPFACHSLANRTLLFDIRKEDWSDELLDWAGIPRAKLGRTLPGGEIAGTVSDQMTRELGLPPGVKVVAGGHDQCCNALGAGVITAGSAVCGIGTVQCITPVCDHIPDGQAMLANGLNVEHHVLPGLYVSFIYNQAGCLVRWFRDTFASADARLAGADSDVYDLLAAEMPDSPTRLLVLPYFEPRGPPGYVSDAAGVVAGLNTGTTRGEILKAIMESTSLYFTDSLEALRQVGLVTSEFVATGGGARSDAWLQIEADVFGVPFVRPRITEASALGAAMLAGIGTGVFASAQECAARFVDRVRVFEPDAVRHRAYQEKAAHYRQLLPLLHGLLSQL